LPRTFDPGYAEQPFRDLVADAPGKNVYPPKDFRLEWGPVFHRGRLDGSARLLVIGQDPAAHETVLRRILVGEAGHRVQGFLWKLGLSRSYVMLNTFLYSVYGQGGGNRHRHNKQIAAYRNRWLQALLAPGQIEAVVALGSLADSAWQDFRASTEGANVNVHYRHVTHPTRPEAAGGSSASRAAATKAMLANWNDALVALHPLQHPDDSRALVRYGEAFKPTEKRAIPIADAPPWAPEWMLNDDGWADRPGTGRIKRATIVTRVPSRFLTNLLKTQ
jgi:uracil-DNA glycosylase